MNSHRYPDNSEYQILSLSLQSIRAYYRNVRIPAKGKGLNLLRLSDGMLIWLLGVLRDIPVPVPAGGDEWTSLLSTVKEQDFAGYLYYLLRTVPDERKPPGQVYKELQRVFHQQSLDHLIIEGELAEIHKILSLAGIRSLLVKGPALGYRIYPSPSLRPFRDIDLFICPDQIVQATEILKNNGFLLFFDGYTLSPELYHHQVLHPASGSRFSRRVEIHWNPLFYPVQGISTSIEDLIRSGVTIHTSWGDFLTLDLPDSLLYGSMHMSLTHAGEIRLIWMADISLLIGEITRLGIWDQVQRQAGIRGGRSALERTIMLNSLWFGSCLPSPFHEFSQWLPAGEEDAKSLISADMRMTGKEHKVYSFMKKMPTLKGKILALLYYCTAIRAVQMRTERRELIPCVVIWFSIVKITLNGWIIKKFPR